MALPAVRIPEVDVMVVDQGLLKVRFEEYEPPHRGELRFPLELTKSFEDGIEADYRVPTEDARWIEEHFGLFPGCYGFELANQCLLRYAATTYTAEELEATHPVMGTIRIWKPRRPILPGDLLTIRLSRLTFRLGYWFARAEIFVNVTVGEGVAERQLVANGQISGGLVAKQPLKQAKPSS